MSDEGDKTCPLCAEEMDLTDQQLKPCKCGYEICVWCWHHIMEMAEKEETDGCCPACRKPYDKERIVGTGANCERLVAEFNMEKKHKSQKAKSKTSENRKQLSSVRVIQKNLVYIVGLPLSLADEDILQRKEYFSQYGKVLKVSISRTSAGTIQQFPNNTCSVYITYGKEEEAVRCIQSVHGFILDGRPLRVCFGTTKYCHAWLRNMPCSNPDCLYLHEIGSQEDSFTKDEVISAYTRSRVQQITGYTNNTQRRAGNVLPPPADDYCNNNAPPVAKPVVKSSSNNSASGTRVSPPTSSSGRSGALPPAASWGARASNANNPPAGAVASSYGPTKQKSEIVSGSQPLSTVSSILQDKLSSDGGKKLMTNEDTHSRQTTKRKDTSDTSKQNMGRNTQTIATEVSPTSSGMSAVKSETQSPNPSVASNNDGDSHVLHNPTLSVDGQPCSPVADKSASSIADEENKNICSDLSSLSIDNRLEDEHSGSMRPNGLCLENFLSTGNQRLQLHDPEEFQQHSTLGTDTSAVNADNSALSSSDVCDWKSDAQAPVKQNPTSETEDDFDSQRLQDAIVVSQATIPSSSPLHFLNHLRGPSLQHVDNAYGLDYASNPPSVNRVPDGGISSVVSGASNGFLDNFVNHASGHSNPLSLLGSGQVNQVRKYNGVMPIAGAVPGTDFGESSIISNILDLDSWDESLTSPHNLAKLLGEDDKQEGSITLGGPWKGQNSNQSRFSFARQEESRNHLYNFESPLNNIGQLANNHSVGQGFVENRDLYMGRHSNSFGLSHGNIEQSDMLANGNSIFPSTSRSQISAPRPPPGFAAPSRPPPPGFNLHERSDQTFELKSGNHLPEVSTLMRNTYQSSPMGNLSTNSNDVEFLDPAILAVGKGSLPGRVNSLSIDMRSNYHVQNPSFENESRLLLMQRSLSPHQNLRYNDVRDNFLPVNDVFGFNTARHLEQSQQVSNLSSFSQFSVQQSRNTVMSNGHWDNWNEIPATNDSISDLLRNDRLGYTKFGMAGSGDLYNSFRM